MKASNHSYTNHVSGNAEYMRLLAMPDQKPYLSSREQMGYGQGIGVQGAAVETAIRNGFIADHTDTPIAPVTCEDSWHVGYECHRESINSHELLADEASAHIDIHSFWLGWLAYKADTCTRLNTGDM